MSTTASFRRDIVVDMTPLGPGGENGGAGLVATSLVRHLSELDRFCHFSLLTAEPSHAELSSLERNNVSRRLVIGPRPPPLAARLFDRAVPAKLRVRAKRAYRTLRTARLASASLDADLLFCPFTIPTFWRAGVPCVSIVYDLQHLAYPEFFTAEQRLNRQDHVREALARSTRVIAISEYVRQTLQRKMGADPSQIVTIPLGLLYERSPADTGVVERLGLERENFLLYPANFWPHKNHRRLLEGLRLYRARNPDSTLRLVCTGAPNVLMRDLQQTTQPEIVTFGGYVTEAELAALYEASAAVIFPSLYEGFGMPVLEALHRATPVLCSDLAVLREVAGDCATYFDPLDPAAIARCIEQLPRGERSGCGPDRAALFGDAALMAERYLALFEEVLSIRDAAA